MTTSWREVFISEVAAQIARDEEVVPTNTYRLIGVRLWGKGAYDRGEIYGKNTKYKKFFRMCQNDIVVNKIWARNGSIAVVPGELNGTYGSGEFPVFQPDESQLYPRWFHWMTQWKPLWLQCEEKSRGATGKNRIKPTQFLEVKIPLPPLAEQRRIVQKLDKVAARAEKAKSLTEQIDEGLTALLHRRIEELTKDISRAPMGKIAPVIRRQVEIDPDAWYPELGIRSFGKGTFHKDPIKGSELGSKRLFQIMPGDLLFSNVFSWEGAIAVVKPEDKGRFGSHRFISCVPDPKHATAQFLCWWFLGEEGLSDIRAASPGAAGRNKTLGVKKLEAIEVPLPPIERQHEFGDLLRLIQRSRSIHQQMVVSIEALMPALLDQAFRGDL